MVARPGSGIETEPGWSAYVAERTVAESMDLKQVVIADDDHLVLRILRGVFEQAGFIVHTAHDGQEALALINKHPVDVLITDINMPNMDGQALCKELAAPGNHLPRCVFVVTSLTGNLDRAWVELYPCISIVEKPVGPRHLLRLVMRRLEADEQEQSDEGCQQNRRAA